MELFDEAVILRALPAPAASSPEPLAVLSFAVDSTGALDGPRVIGGALEPDDADHVQAAAARAFRGWVPPGGRFGARLRIECPGEHRLSFHTRVECLPVYTRGAQQRLERWVTTHQRQVRESVEIVVDFWVTEVGQAENGRIRESSGDDAIDRSLVRLLEHLRFHPALVDGEPVATWARLPVRLRLPGRVG
ncbi:MAG: TonB family protein [Gemmatimonadota bacterium]